MSITYCDTNVVTNQKVNIGVVTTIQPFHCTLSAHRMAQLLDLNSSHTIIHYFAMDAPESKKAHPALEGLPKKLWAIH